MTEQAIPAEEPRRRSGIPGWVWGCGAGCLALGLLFAGLIAWGIVQAKRYVEHNLEGQIADPAANWAGIGAILPFDEPPEGVTPIGFSVMGMEQFVLSDDAAGYLGVLTRFPEEQGAALESFLDPGSFANRGFLGFGGVREPFAGAIVVQGREVRCLRFGDPQHDGAGSIRLDLSQGSPRAVMLQLVLLGDEGPISDEAVASFLEPFDVWRGR